jgi:serine incorporator 1/3
MRTDDDIELAAKPKSSKDGKYEAVATKGNEKPEEEEKNEIGYWGLSMSLLTMLLLWIACIVLRYEEIDWGSVKCEMEDTDDVAESMCIRQNAIYRMTTVVGCFFLLQAVVVVWNVAAIFDHYWITVKLPVIILSTFCLIFFPSSYFDDAVFIWWARIGAFCFIIFQQIILLDFAYMWNSKWFNNHRASNPMVRDFIDGSECNMVCRSVWLVAILAVAACLFAIFIAGMVLLYKYYGGEGCSESNTIITISLLGMTGAGVIQLSSSNGSLLTTTVLMIYVAYITYASVSLNANADCNPLADSGSNGSYGTGPAVMGLIISLGSMVYMSTITTRSVSALFSSGDASAVIRGGTSGASSAPDLKKKARKSVFLFNLVYAFLAMYLAMTMTNWGLRIRSLETADSETSNIGMWMQASAAWVTITLYSVALIAPIFNIIPRSVWDFYPTSINSS